MTYLPEVAKSVGVEAQMIKAFIGGCTLKRHIEELTMALKDPEYVSHNTNAENIARKNNLASLPAIIKSRKWDVVVIQQSAAESENSNTYEPYIGQLIAYLRTNAPEAEIILQQTWSFSAYSSHPNKLGGQAGQFAKIAENYKTMAKKYHLRVIPTGLAVQLARQNVTYKILPREELDTLKPPQLPPPSGDVAGNYSWIKDKESGKSVLKADPLHMNRRGKYLQACVWLGIIFGIDPVTVKYVPTGVSPDDAKFLRECASRAIKEYRQDSVPSNDKTITQQ